MTCLRSLALAILFAAAPAGAALLPATGTLSFSIATLPTVALTGSGSAASNGGPGSSHTVPGGFFDVGPTPISIPITPTLAALAHLTVPASLTNAAGSFAPNGAMPLAGSLFLFGISGTPAGSVPLAPIGGGGTTMFVFGVQVATLVGATFQGAGGAGPAVFQGVHAALAIPITVTATAYDNRTSGGIGAVQLVAPATGSLGLFGSMPAFGVLEITYTPEPTTALLVGVGLTVLGARMRRTRKR